MSGLGAHLALKADNSTGLCCTIYEATLKLKAKRTDTKSAFVYFFFCLGSFKFERLYIKKRKRQKHLEQHNVRSDVRQIHFSPSIFRALISRSFTALLNSGPGIQVT